MTNYKSKITYYGDFGSSPDIQDAKMVFADVPFEVKRHLTLEDFNCYSLEEMQNADLIKKFKYNDETGEIEVEFWGESQCFGEFERCCHDFIADSNHTELNISTIEDLIKNFTRILRLKVEETYGIKKDKLEEILESLE